MSTGKRIKSVRPVSRISTAVQWVKRENVLASILTFGFLLRIVPILWGVPVDPFVRDYHPDEGKILSSVVEFPEVYWTTRPFPGYGTSLQYLVGALLAPVKYLVLESPDKITLGYYVFAKLTARFLSVVSGVLSVYLTYILSMKLFDKTTAVISALFLSTAFFHVLNSPVATLDVATSFLLVLNFLCCFHAIEKKDTIHFAVLGVTTGLMIGTKLTMGLFFAVPLFLLTFDRLVPPEQPAGMIGKPASSKSVAVPLVVLFSIAMVVYFVLNPQVLLDLGKTVAFYAREKRDWVDRAKSSLPGMFRAWAESTRQATSLWVGILGCIGMVVPGKKRLSYKLSIVLFLLLYYGLWRWFLLPRYVITIAPLFCMFAANTCASLMNRGGKVFYSVGAVAVGLVTILSAANCILGISDRLHDSRPAASRYIHENIPPGATIGVCGTSEDYPWTTHAWMYPKIDGKRYRLTDFLAEPEYLVMNRGIADPVVAALQSGKVSMEYVLHEQYRREWYRFSPPSPRIFRFYENMLVKGEENYKIIAAFPRKSDVPLEFPSPEILIFRRGHLHGAS